MVFPLVLAWFYCKLQYYFKSICRQEKCPRFVIVLILSVNYRVISTIEFRIWLDVFAGYTRLNWKSFLLLDFVTTVLWKRSPTRDRQKKPLFSWHLTPFGRDVLFKSQFTACYTLSSTTLKFSSLRFPRESLSIKRYLVWFFFPINYTGDDRYEYPCGDALARNRFVIVASHKWYRLISGS